MTVLLVFSMAMLALGTFAFRYFGTVLDQYLTGFQRYETLLNNMGMVLLISVAAVAMIYEAGEFAGWARCTGVLIAGVLAYCRVNILGVLLAGTLITAGLRLLGIA
ncbi:AzlD domain-containing protein [Marinomonas sp. GJ51-6]|uniref:AzlD domain-containing protein n=1 Tax=Marinomonas sp. GJ51-6 TaxID=2992802 RepID=UPI0029340ECC|nr:AzlD domain-containing protein [Marinomonas sp. GJ51-6]WOD08581.1 AzlD domain-containing protein [Marinomonas sp. GJ51-6]